jgi:hypothetical protein
MLAFITTSQVSQQIHSLNWQTPSWDLFVFLFWAVASIIYAFAAGRGRIISLLMSLYITQLLVLEAPWLTKALSQKVPSGLASIQFLVSFLIIFILLFALLGRYAFRTSADGRHFGSIPFTVIFSFLQVGLLINIIFSYLPAKLVQSFSPLVQTIFIAQPANFVWLLAPLIFLIILGRSVADPTEV